MFRHHYENGASDVIRTILVTAVVLAAVAAVVGSTASSAQQPPDRDGLVITDRLERVTFIDRQPKSKRDELGLPITPGPGDELIVVSNLDFGPEQRGGRGTYHCVAVAAKQHRSFGGLCTYDLSLPEGHITGSGDINLFGRSIEIPITGGTGSHAAARGTLIRNATKKHALSGGLSGLKLVP